MLNRLSLRAKIMIPMTASVVVTGLTLTLNSLNTMETLIHTAEHAELDAHFNAFTNAIASESRIAESMSALVAGIPSVQEAFAKDDRQALINTFSHHYQTLSHQYGIDQFQFHTSPAISYLRVHKVDKFGDDLSAFRHSVVDSNKNLRPIRGLENGVAGLGLRGIVPVFYQQQHIGSVEFGMSFGQPFFEQFKQQNKVEANLHTVTANGFTTLAGTTGHQPLLDHHALSTALQGKKQIVPVVINNIQHTLLAQAVHDYAGKPIGVVEIAMDNTQYIQALSKARNHALWIGSIMFVMGLLISWFITQYIIKRIHRIGRSVNLIAQGDLSEAIIETSQDELGQLAKSTNIMREQLNSMAEQVTKHAKSAYQAAQEISNAVENQAATSSQMSASVAEITSTMEELSASSTQIAEHSKSVVTVANQAMSGSYSGSEAMQVVLARMQDIRNDNQASLQEIIELGNKSKQISKIMVLINSVADQTKLIAFNAALEASSAGEAGKRFSVVASEIRRLADSVTDSTNEIETKISEIQDAINRLVITSEKGANGILAGTVASNTTAERFNEIVTAVNQTSTAAQQISLSTQQQKTASNQVVIALREIVGASNHTATSINRIAQISHDMVDLSEKLSNTTAFFKQSSRVETT